MADHPGTHGTDALREEHVHHNQVTRGDRDGFSNHREHLMRLIRAASGDCGDIRAGSDRPLSKVALLGAGNCNDLDLPWLLGRFGEVHLVDLDPDALEFGYRSVEMFQERMRRHAPFDVASPLMSGTVDEGIVEGSPAATDQCDLVVSGNLLSQLVFTLNTLVRRGQVAVPFLQAVQWIRRGHFRTIAGMLRPGGRAVITIDFVSSDSAPRLLSDPVGSNDQASLNRMAIELLRSSNFFTGLNPAVVFDEVRRMGQLAIVDQAPPWVWHVGPRRYLVAGIVVQRVNDVSSRSEIG